MSTYIWYVYAYSLCVGTTNNGDVWGLLCQNVVQFQLANTNNKLKRLDMCIDY